MIPAQKHMRAQAGFTLVELAIVMIIIGLLIAGVLKGQALIGNAKVTAQVAQVKSIDAATSTFKDMYASLPGDILTPTTRLPNCAAAPCSTAGNGDGIVTPVPGTAVAVGNEAADYFVQLSAADLITGINHLLAMTSGLDWPERAISLDDWANIVRQGWSAPDPYRFVLARPVEKTPGTAWNYNSGGVWLLGLILRKVSKQPIEEFAKEALLEPLGIQDEVWGRFPNGDAGTSGGLRLRLRDLAKLGQLVLDGGVWHGRQIVSAGWIKQMIAPQSPRGLSLSFARSYGYLWWQGRSVIGGHEIEWVGALGRGGQRLYVVPALNLVVAVTAGLYIANSGSPAPESLAGDTALNSFVLPAALGHAAR